MPEATPPPAAAPAAPAQPQAPTRAAARAARIDGVKAKLGGAATPAAEPAKPAAVEPPKAAAATPAAPAEPAKPAAKVEPPKPKTDLERLFDEAKEIAARRPPAPKAAAPAPVPAPVAPAAPAPAATPTAAQKASIFRIAAEAGLDKFDLLRHFTAELKADRELPFTGQPAFDPNRERFSKNEEVFSELRKELDEVKQQNTELRQTWEQQQQAQYMAVQSANAVKHMQTDAKRWPILNLNPNREAVGSFIVDAVNTAAQYAETRGLTVEEILDRVEKFESAKLEPYKNHFAPAASAAPPNPQPAAKTDGQTTIAPGSLAPQGGEPPPARRSRQERMDRALAALHKT